MSPAPARQLFGILVLAGVYIVVAKVGLSLEPVAGRATVVWPATGIALVALLRSGYSLWPGIALGAFVVNLWVGAPVAVAIGIAIGNTLEAILGTYALRRVNFRSSLERVRDVLALVVFASILSSTVSATIGVASLSLGGIVAPDRVVSMWREWWLGDAMDDLILVPVLLIAMPWVRSLRGLSRARVIEGAALGAAIAGVSLLVFSGWWQEVFQRSYLVFPVLIWAALRFRTPGASLGTFAIVSSSIAATALGVGPFVGGELSDNLFALQAFMAIVAITILLLGAVSSERDEAIRKRQEFLEVISHELKNPLSVVQLSAEVLSMKLPADEALRGRATIIQRSTKTMLTLIQNLLDSGALESERLTVDPRTEDIGGVVAEAMELLRPLASQKSQSIEVRLTDSSCTVICDRDRIIQVLSNLVGNAVKFSPDGSRITVCVREQDDRVRISVHDTGPGIPPEQIAHVFERRWRARWTGQRGSGLGLFICQGLVQAHAGEIWVESKVGSGSVFHFTLPTSKAAQPAVPLPIGPSESGLT